MSSQNVKNGKMEFIPEGGSSDTQEKYRNKEGQVVMAPNKETTKTNCILMFQT